MKKQAKSENLKPISHGDMYVEIFELVQPSLNKQPTDPFKIPSAYEELPNTVSYGFQGCILPA